MKMRSFLKCFLIFSLSLLLSCSGPMALYEFPEKVSTKFDLDLVAIEKLSDADVNDDFSNCDDLQFLLPLVRDRRLVLIGETHYYSRVRNIANRLIFALNRYADFSFVSLEAPFSISPFINYYIHLNNDSEAAAFYRNELKDAIYAEELEIFLAHARQWNKRFLDRQIDIGAHDVEYEPERVFARILIPYFKKFHELDNTRIAGFETSDPQSLLKSMRYQLSRDQSKGLVGRYPFITKNYIDAVLKNMASTFKAKGDKFNLNRQKAIIRNLTDDHWLGQYLKRGRAVLYGGGQHMRTKSRFEKGSYYWEGEYFNHLNELTQGRCYSISINGVAFDDKNAAKMSRVHSWDATLYHELVTALMYRDQNNNRGKKRYYAITDFNDFRSLLVLKARKASANSFRITRIDYEGLKYQLKNKPIAEYPEITMELNYLKAFDMNLYVMKSGVWQVME